jgi:hypothetical protein
MTETEALAFYEMVFARLFGWTLALGAKDGRRDYRLREAKQADALFRRLMIEGPSFDTQISTLMAGGDIIDHWPRDLQAVARFEIEHKVPWPNHEPTCVEFAESMIESGRTDYQLPELLAEHGKAATVEDHPPLPALLMGTSE